MFEYLHIEIINKKMHTLANTKFNHNINHLIN